MISIKNLSLGNTTFYRKNTRYYDKNSLYSDFKTIDWNKITNTHMEDTNESFNSFFNKIESLLDKHIPLKKVSNKNFKQKFKPWITKGILKSLKKRQDLHNRFIRAKTIDSKQFLYDRFKRYRNMLVTLTRRSKENYFSKYFADNVKNLRETWKGIKNIIQLKNYRPISLLSNISKIIEKLMYSRLYNFLSIYNCISELQFGFRSKHSTSHALLSITEKNS